MQLDYLLEFAVLAECLNFSEASEKLYISESSLSRHIKQLESELGCKLFERSTRKVKLTSMGKAIYPICNEFKIADEHLQSTLETNKKTGRNTINIGIQQNITSYFDLYTLVKDFLSDHGRIKINIHDTFAPDIDTDIKQDKNGIMFAPVSIDNETRQNNHVTLFHDQIIAVLPKDSDLIHDGKITYDALKDQGLILAPTDSPMYSLCMKSFRANDIEPNIVLTLQDGDKTIELANKSLGIALLSRHTSFIKHPDYPYYEDLYFAEFDPPLNFDIDMVYSSNPSNEVSLFIDYTEESLKLGKYIIIS